MHQLSLYIPNDLNAKAFKIIDTSVYNTNLEVKNGILEVTPPGFSYAIIFRVNEEFEKVFNANLLHLNSGSDIPTLLDGVYKLKYSVDPNVDVNVEYYYFRNILQQINYHNSLYNFLNNSFDKRNYKLIQKEYLWIKELMDNAKYIAEFQADIKTASSIYEEVNNLIFNLDAKCQ